MSLEDLIVETVIESSDFTDAVINVVRDEVEDRVDQAIEDADLDEKVEDAVRNFCGSLDDYAQRSEVERLKETIEYIIRDYEKLKKQVELLKDEIIMTNTNVGILSNLLKRTREALRTIPIIRRKFM